VVHTKKKNEMIITPQLGFRSVQKIQMKKVTLALVLALMLSATLAHGDPIPISVPTVITSPGNYLLVNDISGIGGGSAAIDIQANDVKLDLGGHTISSPYIGVSIDFVPGTSIGANNVKVTGGKIVAGSAGVVTVGSDGTIINLDITIGPSAVGVELERPGNGTKVAKCSITGPSGFPAVPAARAAFETFLTSNNNVSNIVLDGVFIDTIQDDDQSGPATVKGNNSWDNITFAHPTQ
jgi:hypothetical protein